MLAATQQFARRMINRLGYTINRAGMPSEFDESDRDIVNEVIAANLTMVSRERLYSTAMACHHVLRANVPGDFVECGVWRGGNAVIAGDIFHRHDPSRKLWLYDTYAGMTQPSDVDKRVSDNTAAIHEYATKNRQGGSDWCFASLQDVRSQFENRGLLSDGVRFVVGDVTETLRHKENLPESISVLKLDTDWYKSTKAELEVLYPLLSPGGVLILDDYGYWQGTQKAVDEFFTARPRPYFQYVDEAGRAGVKPI